ncbi:MAG: DUF4493 domain-containing protein [Bacteroidaceae bacterium]|nr:DUF4493 domain-containing protein [Bacteroidaceae bacterium]
MTNKIFFLLLAAALMLAGCTDEAVVAESGWLEISSVRLIDAERVVVQTRAADSDLNVDIYNAAGTKVLSYPAGSLAAGKKVYVAAGTYRFHAYTSNYNTPVTSTDPGTPKFSGERTFAVKTDVVTYLEMEVPMVNAAVSLTLPEDFSSLFTSYTFTANVGSRTMVVTDGNTAYFDLKGNDKVIYTLSATNIDGETMSQQGTFNIYAGYVYDITFAYGDTQKLSPVVRKR